MALGDIGHRLQAAIEDAEKHGASEAATFLRVGVMEIIAALRRKHPPSCALCDLQPTAATPPQEAPSPHHYHG